MNQSKLTAAEKFFNRELSWLAFNERVLSQASDPDVPLLERLKFLAISCSNMDEFFMVRVGGLLLQRETGAKSTDPSGMSVNAQLRAIRERTTEMVERQYAIYHDDLVPALKQQGIERVPLDDCSVRHEQATRRAFDEEIFAVLSPMAIPDAQDFPLVLGRQLYLGVELSAPDTEEGVRFVVIPIGKAVSRILTLPTDNGFSFTLLEDVVRRYVGDYFPGEEVLSTAAFRITRNADIELQEDQAADLLHGMQELLQQRKTAQCVRLEIDAQATDAMVTFLHASLGIGEELTIRAPDPVDLSFLMGLSGLDGFEYLRDEPWPPQRSPEIDPTQSMFSTIAEQDLLLCHPYESYAPVVRLIAEAADDPDVLAIKQTLYRAGSNSGIVAALQRAAERGKYVTAIVELKARFDEARNIEWAKELEEAGVQVIYGVKNLKTHAKICIIVRREPRGIVRYMHFGTGNYNESTAKLYSDISYFTCDSTLGSDASTFFNSITGYSQPQPYMALEAAPLGLRKKLLTLIDSEIERRKQGQRASIMAKLNALVDKQLIEALYRASQAGVTIQLNVRGICCLRPGVPGLSENITVVSIVDRLLEHARMIYFHHGGDELTFISSADWMPRNLDKRIELLVPVQDNASRKRMIRILETYFKDTENAWQLNAEGEFVRRSTKKSQFRSQQVLYQAAIDAVKATEQRSGTFFEPHQPKQKKSD